MPKRPVRLSNADIESALAHLPLWRFHDGKLLRDYDFGDFSKAVACLTGLAIAAAELDHHPNWSGVYGRLNLELSTHDAGGVTALDFTLAARVELLAAALGTR